MAKMSDLWELHLKAALLLVGDFRAKVIMQDLDPRAVRVALKYALKVDEYLSKQHGLTEAEEQQIEKLAQKLFLATPQVREAEQKNWMRKKR